MRWLTDNLPSVLVLIGVILLVALLSYSLVRAKRRGKSCCGGCSGCAMAGKCHGSCEKEEKTGDGL